MEAESTARRVLLVLASILMVLFSVASMWAFISDYESRDIVSTGVTLVGTDLTGMNTSQVRSAIEQAVSTPMMRPVSVTGESKSWTLDPKTFVEVDADAMIAAAYAPKRKATLIERLNSQITGQPLAAEVKPEFTVDSSVVATWVKEAAAQVNRKPVNATRAAVKYAIKITPAVYGASLDETAAADQLTQALSADAALSSASREVSLPVNPITPKIVESSFKTAIVVSLSQCKIRLYKGAKLVKTYSCAPGRPSWPTPTGDFKINAKLKNSPWYNPHSAWSASMPDVIPGGPSNPMGDTKIGITYPGVFMHAVPPSEFGSIGTHASHGCMRMMPSAVHDLFKRVNIGDPVFIRD